MMTTIDRTKARRRRRLMTMTMSLTVTMTVGAVLGVSGRADAQSLATSQANRPLVQQNEKPANKIAPPPALPGSKPASADPAAPADRLATDMEPNEALFDAINRGDVAAAKDALSRGADIDSRNVLGLSPLELSVDLGRNDLSFLLLSMRGSGSARPAGAAVLAAQAPPARPARPTVREQRQAAAAARPAPAPVAQRPQLFAGNGGAPVPQAGFLGFNSARTP